MPLANASSSLAKRLRITLLPCGKPSDISPAPWCRCLPVRLVVFLTTAHVRSVGCMAVPWLRKSLRSAFLQLGSEPSCFCWEHGCADAQIMTTVSGSASAQPLALRQGTAPPANAYGRSPSHATRYGKTCCSPRKPIVLTAGRCQPSRANQLDTACNAHPHELCCASNCR